MRLRGIAVSPVMVILGLAIFIGCGEDSSIKEQAYPQIHLLLAPQAENVRITKVVLTVSGPDMEPMEFELKVEGRKAAGTVIVPAGERRLFVVKAYSDVDVESEGQRLINLKPGSSIALELKLERVRLSIEIIPLKEKMMTGETIEVEVWVKHVRELFGCTFELEYDEEILEPVKAMKGDLLGGEALFLSQFDPGRVSVGVTRKAGSDEVNGSGVVAKVVFRAKSPGDVTLRILKGVTLTLCQENGDNVPGFDRLMLKNAEITIK